MTTITFIEASGRKIAATVDGETTLMELAVAIANTDSEARAYMDSAWDAAFRAVEEQTV
jgi:hypothetical protein